MEKTKHRKTPQLRFAGFPEDWEDKPIGKVLTETKRSITLEDHKQYELITVKRRNGGVVSRGRLYGRQILVKNYSQLKAGDFLISKRQVVHGATGVVPPELNQAIVSNEYLVAVGNSEISTAFLGIISTLPEMYRKFFLSSYGVDIEKLFFDVEDWKKRAVTIPNPAEQDAICTLFKELDRVIGLHQRKHEKLVTLKQAMLQKMFPPPDATTPEIRFKGFKGSWSKTTLGELSEIVGGGTPSTSVREYWGGEIDWYSPTEIGNRVYANGSVKKITALGLANSSSKLLPANRTILFTSRAGIGDMAILSKEGCTNQGFQSMVLHDGIDPYFIYSMGFLIKSYALKHASGSTFLEVSSKQLSRMRVLLPREAEQQKIGTYFRQLDALISLHATQLTKLKNIKAACIERMFV